MILILSIFSLITDNEYDFPSNSLSSCEAVFNTSEVAFYYLETLNITGCTLFTNLTKSSFPTGYSTTHLKLSYGGLEYVEADSLLVRILKCYLLKLWIFKKKKITIYSNFLSDLGHFRDLLRPNFLSHWPWRCQLFYELLFPRLDQRYTYRVLQTIQM